MKANDLGIGNLYNSVKFNQPVKCELSDLRELYIMSDGAYNDPPINEMFEPIPLTEEWLIKSKAKKVANTYHLDRFLFIWKPEYEYWYVVDLDSLAYLTKIEFVHELQNFYFVMQGKELEIVA